MHCRLCELIVVGIPNTENADNLNVSETTIRRHLKHRDRMNQEAAASGEDDFFGVPEEIITSRGKTVRLPDGSYEKINYSPARLAMLQALTYDDIERAIEGFVPQPYTGKPVTDTEVLCLADFQIGKTDRFGGTEETLKRVLESVYIAAEQYRHTRPAEIILLDLGDVIENFFNTSSQPQTNDLDLTNQIRSARRTLVEIIRIMAPLAPRVVFGSIPSNHCEVRVGPKSPASTPHNDFGIEINYQIEDVLSGRPGFEHVEFVRPGEYDESITITLGTGDVIGAVHGHQGGAWHSMGKWWGGQSHGRRNGLDKANTLFVGHWHQWTTYPSGDDRRVIIAPSSDNGSSWHTNKTGDWNRPAMLAVGFHEGRPTDPRIL